jgi:hypothetical protein
MNATTFTIESVHGIKQTIVFGPKPQITNSQTAATPTQAGEQQPQSQPVPTKTPR